jgi:hypothetical protein
LGPSNLTEGVAPLASAAWNMSDLLAWIFTKERIPVAVAESGRSGAVECLGPEPGAIAKLCGGLRRPGKPLAFCYEAGPCGHGVNRQ